MLRRLAGLDGSQGTSADNEVAVVGNSRSESRSVAVTNRNRGGRLAWKSSGIRACRSVVGDCRTVRGSSAEHGTDCRVVGKERPTVVRVRRAVR